jgi:hypothetical protein
MEGKIGSGRGRGKKTEEEGWEKAEDEDGKEDEGKMMSRRGGGGEGGEEGWERVGKGEEEGEGEEEKKSQLPSARDCLDLYQAVSVCVNCSTRFNTQITLPCREPTVMMSHRLPVRQRTYKAAQK